MTIDKDPPRLTDSASPDDALLRDALREARTDVSPDDAITRMLARFPPGPGPGGGLTGPDPGVGKGAVGAGAGKAALGKGAVGTSVLAGAGKGAVGTSVLAGAGASTPLFGSVVVGALAGVVFSFGLWASGVGSGPPPPNVPVSVAAPRSSANPGDLGAAREGGPAGKPSSDSPSPAQRPAAAEPSSARAAPLPGASSSAGAPPAEPASTSSAGSAGAEAPTEIADESEGAYLARAQALLGGNPSGALALAEQHRSRYPKGTLGQEREVIAITARVGMGRTADARARAEALLAKNPSSAHRRRLSVIVPGLPSD